MRIKITLIYTIFYIPFFIGCGQETEKVSEYEIKQNKLKEQIYFLASDELMGRNTGSEEIKIAAKYIADYFKSIGVKEFSDAPGFLQKVPLKVSKSATLCDLEIDNLLFTNGVDLVLRAGGKLTTTAGLLFIPNSWWEEQSDQAITEGINNKIIITELGASQGMGFGEIMSRSEKRKEVVRQKGGVAFVEIYDHAAQWTRLTLFLNRPSMELDFSEHGASNSELIHIWINIEDQELVGKIKEGKQLSAKINSGGKTVNRFKDQNVVGYIPGTDPDLKDEYVLLTAHYDHLGAGMKNGRSATPEDTIFNGAGDNAMGTVAVMGAAKAFSIQPAKRPVIFLAVTGEEKGLLGSKYFAENPLVPLHQIIFNLNNDGGGMADNDIVNVLGIKRTGTADMAISACEEFGLAVNSDGTLEFLFNASDNVSFVSKGIPAMTFSPGFRIFNQEIPKHYHRPSDEPETVDYEYYIKFVRAFARTARNIADASEKPQWIPGDPYEQAGKKLYNLKD